MLLSRLDVDPTHGVFQAEAAVSAVTATAVAASQ
jgi:hypothetical protein